MDTAEAQRVQEAITALRDRIAASASGQRPALHEQLNQLRREHWILTHPHDRS